METIDHLRDLVSHGDFMASIDLSDAFHSVSIHPSSKNYLCFNFEGVSYRFNVLPFGMTSSPRIFSKVLRPCISHLRSQGIKISSYLDDIFICANSADLLNDHISTTLKLLISLGYHPNYEKSNLTPSRSLPHLGFIWNSIHMTLAVPEEKIIKTRDFAKKMLTENITVRNLSSFLGLIISLQTAFKWAPLYYRNIQLQYCDILRTNCSWNSIIKLNKDSISNVCWWLSCPPLDPSPFTKFIPKLTLHCDSSLFAWGGYLNTGEVAYGSWSKTESHNHINYLELHAIFLCVQQFKSILTNNSLSIYSDNFTAVCYINKIGGTHSKELCKLALALCNYMRSNNITFTARHIAGKDNTLADDFSRQRDNRHDYYFNQVTFNTLTSHIPFDLEVDVFASKFTKKLDNYISLFPDPSAYKVDAFSLNWFDNMYLFPPINLIPKVVSKITTEHVSNCLLITPAWRSLISLPTILSLLISEPIFIPSHFLLGKLPTRHPFNLIAWPLSTDGALIERFQKESAKLSEIASRSQHWLHINDSGKNFILSLLKEEVTFLFPFQ